MTYQQQVMTLFPAFKAIDWFLLAGVLLCLALFLAEFIEE